MSPSWRPAADGRLASRTPVQPPLSLRCSCTGYRPIFAAFQKFASGPSKVAKTGTVYVMTGPDMDAENTFEEPEKMASRKQRLQLINGNTYLAPARSVNILRMKLQ